MQRNWIGRSEGCCYVSHSNAGGEARDVEVFTTRADTLFGAKFVAVAADHPLAQRVAEGNAALKSFIDECHQMGTSVAAIETAEKKGFDTGLKVVHRSIRIGCCRSMSPISC